MMRFRMFLRRRKIRPRLKRKKGMAMRKKIMRSFKDCVRFARDRNVPSFVREYVLVLSIRNALTTSIGKYKPGFHAMNC